MLLTAIKKERQTIYQNGVTQDINQGISRGVIQTAKRMLNENVDVALIAKVTQLSEQENTNAVIIPISLWEKIKLVNVSPLNGDKEIIRQRVKQQMKKGYPLNIAETFQRDECYER